MCVGTTRYLSVIVNCVISCYVLFQYLYLSSSYNQILCIHQCWNLSTIHFSQGWVSIKYSINWKVSQSVARLSGWQGDMQSEYNHNTNRVIFSHFSKQIKTKKCQQITLSKKYKNCWSVHASFMHCAVKLKRHISVQKSSSTAFLLQNKSSRNPWLPDFKPLNNWHCREKKTTHTQTSVWNQVLDLWISTWILEFGSDTNTVSVHPCCR